MVTPQPPARLPFKIPEWFKKALTRVLLSNMAEVIERLFALPIVHHFTGPLCSI